MKLASDGRAFSQIHFAIFDPILFADTKLKMQFGLLSGSKSGCNLHIDFHMLACVEISIIGNGLT